MRKLYWISSGCLALLAACEMTPQYLSDYYRAGVSPGKIQADKTSCQITALREVPRAMATGQTPTYTTPTYTSPTYTNCYGGGYSASCTTTGGNVSGGQTYGGQVYSYDANQELRQKVEAQCMAQNGYQYISLPLCTPEQAAGGFTPYGNRGMPEASLVLCVVKGGYVSKPAT